MKFFSVKRKEFIDLRAAIYVAVLLALYVLSLQLTHPEQVLFTVEEGFTLNGFLTYALVVWLFVVLLIAYRRYLSVFISNQELEEVITGINPDAFLVVSPERRVIMCNKTAEQMFGYTAAEILNQPTDVLYFDRRAASDVPQPIREQLERVGFHLGYATGKHKDGRRIPLEIITGIIRSRPGAVLLVRDITARVKVEDAHREKADLLARLEQNFRKLKETEEARDDLLHMIVHDMKTPLQVVLGTTELLLEEIHSGKDITSALVSENLDHTYRLIAMVNSLLDVGRLESGQMPLHMTPCDLRIIARRALAELSFLTRKRAVALELAEAPATATCDPDIIRRVIINLLSNALYYTPDEARVTLAVRAEAGRCRIEVIDNGPGISPEHQKKIFEKFGRVEGQARHARLPSSGIGLAFCKLAVEAHGGQIGVVSEPGRGSTFWFVLTSASAAPPPRPGS